MSDTYRVFKMITQEQNVTANSEEEACTIARQNNQWFTVDTDMYAEKVETEEED